MADWQSITTDGNRASWRLRKMQRWSIRACIVALMLLVKCMRLMKVACIAQYIFIEKCPTEPSLELIAASSNSPYHACSTVYSAGSMRTCLQVKQTEERCNMNVSLVLGNRYSAFMLGSLLRVWQTTRLNTKPLINLLPTANLLIYSSWQLSDSQTFSTMQDALNYVFILHLPM